MIRPNVPSMIVGLGSMRFRSGAAKNSAWLERSNEAFRTAVISGASEPGELYSVILEKS